MVIDNCSARGVVGSASFDAFEACGAEPIGGNGIKRKVVETCSFNAIFKTEVAPKCCWPASGQ